MGKLKTEFASPIAKSTSPKLSDTTFFALDQLPPLMRFHYFKKISIWHLLLSAYMIIKIVTYF